MAKTNQYPKDRYVPAKEARPARAARVKAPWRGFIDYPLSSEDLDVIKAGDWSAEWFGANLERLLHEGYNAAFSRDAENAVFKVTLTVADQEDVDAGLGVTGRGSTFAKALRQVVYVHEVLLQGGWSAYWERRFRRVTIDD